MIGSDQDFVIIGENIHATRIVLLKGIRVTNLEDGTEAVIFRGESGEQRFMPVPESYKRTQPYEQGQVKHYMIAVQKGLSEDPEEQAQGRAYVHYGVRRQVDAGADFLDLNVDEVSYKVDVQKRAMEWLVEAVQEVSPVPPSVDSSNADIIAAGLARYDGPGRPAHAEFSCPRASRNSGSGRAAQGQNYRDGRGSPKGCPLIRPKESPTSSS